MASSRPLVPGSGAKQAVEAGLDARGAAPAGQCATRARAARRAALKVAGAYRAVEARPRPRRPGGRTPRRARRLGRAPLAAAQLRRGALQAVDQAVEGGLRAHVRASLCRRSLSTAPRIPLIAPRGPRRRTPWRSAPPPDRPLGGDGPVAGGDVGMEHSRSAVRRTLLERRDPLERPAPRRGGRSARRVPMVVLQSRARARASGAASRSKTSPSGRPQRLAGRGRRRRRGAAERRLGVLTPATCSCSTACSTLTRSPMLTNRGTGDGRAGLELGGLLPLPDRRVAADPGSVSVTSASTDAAS